MDILFYCRDTETPPQPVDGVLVRVYRDGAFVTSGTSGSGANGPGELLLSVPAADDYVVRFSMSTAGYEIVSPQAVTVTEEGDAFAIDVERFQHDAATDPRYCRASGFVQLPFRQPLRGVPLRFEPLDPPITGAGAHVRGRALSVATDQNGKIVIDLLRDRRYRVQLEPETETRDVIVPDRSWTDVADLLYPVPRQVLFAPATLSLAVGQPALVRPRVLTSDGTYRTLTELVAGVEFVSDPAGLQLLALLDDLSISAPSAGSYTVHAVLPTSVVDLVQPAPGDPTGSLPVAAA